MTANSFRERRDHLFCAYLAEMFAVHVIESEESIGAVRRQRGWNGEVSSSGGIVHPWRDRLVMDMAWNWVKCPIAPVCCVELAAEKDWM